MANIYFITLYILSCLQVITIKADNLPPDVAKLYIRFVKYENPQGKGANGHCCDGRWGICASKCDHEFTVCLQQDTDINRHQRGCPYGSRKSSQIPDQNVITFGTSFGNVQNPMEFYMQRMPSSGKVALKVDVWDYDGSTSGRDFVDKLKIVVPVRARPHSSTSTTRLLLNSRTKLAIEVFTECVGHSYGEQCDIICVKGAHHRCDEVTGKRICDEGWTGVYCDRRDFCDKNPCQHGGTCKLTNNGYTCYCPFNWFGQNCEQESWCKDNPCKPGSCVGWTTHNKCFCAPGYEVTKKGKKEYCTRMATTAATTTTTTATKSTTRKATTKLTTATTTEAGSEATTRVSRPGSGKVRFIDRPNADCDKLAMNGKRYQDGVYILHVSTLNTFPAYCDMSAEGWTVIQNRNKGELDFYRDWNTYRDGFGEVGLQTEFFLGLEKIYYLTNQRRYKLRISMMLGDHTWRYVSYENFWIENENRQFRLHVSGYSGNAGDALSKHNGDPFSTYDEDNDRFDRTNCANRLRSGWWFHKRTVGDNSCYTSNLNGEYRKVRNGWPRCYNQRCVSWKTIRDYETYSLLRTTMSILPNPRY